MTPKAATETQTPCTPKTPIAIIGMGCIFPESRNLKEFWRLVFNGIDAITQVPQDSHWRLKDYFNERNPNDHEFIFTKNTCRYQPISRTQAYRIVKTAAGKTVQDERDEIYLKLEL